MPDSGIGYRHDRMPWWAGAWMIFPVADRWAHVYYWNHGGFDVEPAPGFKVPDGGWSTAPRPHIRQHDRWWGWDVVTNDQGNWLTLVVPAALVGVLISWTTGSPLWVGALVAPALVLLAIVVVVTIEHRASRRSTVTMSFGWLDEAGFRELQSRLAAEGLATTVEPRHRGGWQIAVAGRHVDRTNHLAEDLRGR
jgi:hypothetical protein